MKEQILMVIITVLTSIVATVIVMILHELTKSIAYLIYVKNYNRKYNKLNICPGIFRLHRYVDPVGLILSVTGYVTISKQYPFLIKSRKASFLIGLIGYITTAVMFFTSVIAYRNLFGVGGLLLGTYTKEMSVLIICLDETIKKIILFSAMLFFSNLFPIASFDISLIVASIDSIAYRKILKFDLFFKLIFLILSLLSVFSMLSVYVSNYFLKL